MGILNRSRRTISQILPILAALAFCQSAKAEQVATVMGGDPIQAAAIKTESISPPGLVAIMALSVASITLVRRRGASDRRVSRRV